MNKKAYKIFWIVILIVEAITFVSMLLCDFGILQSKTDILSVKGIMYQLVAVIVIVIAFVNIKKLK